MPHTYTVFATSKSIFIFVFLILKSRILFISLTGSLHAVQDILHEVGWLQFLYKKGNVLL